MSGLVVRPGDTLVIPLAPGTKSTPDTRAKLKAYMEEDLPGVTVLVCEGPAGGPFVYRPNPPQLPMLPCCGFTDVHASWCPIRPNYFTSEGRDVPSGQSIVDNPVTGKPLGYVKDTP